MHEKCNTTPKGAVVLCVLHRKTVVELTDIEMRWSTTHELNKCAGVLPRLSPLDGM